AVLEGTEVGGGAAEGAVDVRAGVDRGAAGGEGQEVRVGGVGAGEAGVADPQVPAVALLAAAVQLQAAADADVVAEGGGVGTVEHGPTVVVGGVVLEGDVAAAVGGEAGRLVVEGDGVADDGVVVGAAAAGLDAVAVAVAAAAVAVRHRVLDDRVGGLPGVDAVVGVAEREDVADHVAVARGNADAVGVLALLAAGVGVVEVVADGQVLVAVAVALDVLDARAVAAGDDEAGEEVVVGAVEDVDALLRAVAHFEVGEDVVVGAGHPDAVGVTATVAARAVEDGPLAGVGGPDDRLRSGAGGAELDFDGVGAAADVDHVAGADHG